MSSASRFLFFCLCAFLAGSCLAQPAAQARPSLEALVAGADNVFLGKATDFRTHDPAGNQAGLAVQVGTVLKGTASGTINLNVDLRKGWAYLATAVPTDTELLWFTTGKPDRWAVLDIRDAPKALSRSAHFPCLPVIGMDLKPITTRSDALSRVKSILGSGAPSGMLEIRVPSYMISRIDSLTASSELADSLFGQAKMESPGVGADRILVPIVPSIEAVGKWLMTARANEVAAPWLANDIDNRLSNFIRTSAKNQEAVFRRTGMFILSNFRPDGNVGLVKSQLSDGTIVGYARPGEIGQYAIRLGAYDLLVSCGVKVSKPVIDLPGE